MTATPGESEEDPISSGSDAQAAPNELHSNYDLHFSRPSPVDLPALAKGVEPIGGRIRAECEDFRVIEKPLYEFCGRGEHCYVTVTKTNRSTLEMREFIARTLNVSPVAVGYAGLKDKRAVTTQTFSVQGVRAEQMSELESSFLHVESVTYHKNKLRTGHLSGNRFIIKIRDVEEGALEAAKSICKQLCEYGIPNYYGPQRFGRHSDSYLLGYSLLHRNPREVADYLLGVREGVEDEYRQHYMAGRYQQALDALPPGRPAEAGILHTLRRYPGNYKVATRRIPRDIRRIYFSAYQSFLFNWSLLERMQRMEHGHANFQVGDLAFIHQKGASFLVEDLEEANARAAASEISPSGPIFGRKMTFAQGEQGELENAILVHEKMRPASFLSHVKGLSLDGTRRSYRIPLDEVLVESADSGTSLVLTFDLPPGSYATILLEEVMGPGALWRSQDEISSPAPE